MVKRTCLLFAVVLVGCGQYPNPNDLATIATDTRVSVANEKLISAEATLEYKVQHREITDAERIERIKLLAEEMLKSIDPEAIPNSDMWMYAALLRVTDRWPEAEEALKEAVKAASSKDRKINDTLKLALAEAKNHKVKDAIATTESVMDAADVDAAPILPSVLYEIVPAGQGQGHDKELIALLGKAIECHMRVKVDLASESGKAFVMARRYHIKKARAKQDELTASKQ